jgi:hypothetical protein
LLGLAKTINFEDMHFLTREEIARFGLDRREFVETPWNFESNGRSMIHKLAVVRARGETSFRTIQWRVVCFDADRFAMDFQRPAPVTSGVSSVSIAGGDAIPVYFGYAPVKVSGREQWVLPMPHAAIQSPWATRKSSSRKPRSLPMDNDCRAQSSFPTTASRLR